MLWAAAKCSRQRKIVSSIVSNGSCYESPPFLRSKSPNRPELAQIDESPVPGPFLVPAPESSILGISGEDFENTCGCHELFPGSIKLVSFEGFLQKSVTQITVRATATLGAEPWVLVVAADLETPGRFFGAKVAYHLCEPTLTPDPDRGIWTTFPEVNRSS
jgi:hypothetical protein